jgi:hypothetical protein
MSPSPNLNMVVISSSVINKEVWLWLGATNPVLTNGYGGWSTVQRPQRKALTNWEGHNPFQMDLEAWLSEVQRDRSVEDAIQKLEKMAAIDKTLNPNRPPMVRLHGDALPPGAKYLGWVIQDMTWGKTIRSLNHGHRVQQQVTLSLLEHVVGGLVKERGIKPGGGLAFRIYTVRHGDTLKSIAKKLLGKESRWQEIARINHIHNPRNLKQGRKIRVPRK